MKKSLILFVLVAIVLSVLSCSDYNKIYKNASDETRYEVAKKYYQRGDYGKAASIQWTESPLRSMPRNHVICLFAN